MLYSFYRGRGAFESMGAGLHMEPGDIAFKSNFATINTDGIVVKRRADRRFEEEGPILCGALNSQSTSLPFPGDMHVPSKALLSFCFAE